MCIKFILKLVKALSLLESNCDPQSPKIIEVSRIYHSMDDVWLICEDILKSEIFLASTILQIYHCILENIE